MYLHVYRRQQTDPSSRLLLGLYVDNILCPGTNSTIISWFRQSLSKEFSITFNINID